MNLSEVKLKVHQEVLVRRASWSPEVYLVLSREPEGSYSPQAQVLLKGVPLPVALSSADLAADDWEEAS